MSIMACALSAIERKPPWGQPPRKAIQITRAARGNSTSPLNGSAPGGQPHDGARHRTPTVSSPGGAVRILGFSFALILMAHVVSVILDQLIQVFAPGSHLLEVTPLVSTLVVVLTVVLSMAENPERKLNRSFIGAIAAVYIVAFMFGGHSGTESATAVVGDIIVTNREGWILGTFLAVLTLVISTLGARGFFTWAVDQA